MTDIHDQELTALFKAANQPLSAEDITQQIMLKVRTESRRATLLWLTSCVVLLVFMWLFSAYIQSAGLVIATLPSEVIGMLLESIQESSNDSLISPVLLTWLLPVGIYFLLRFRES